MIRFPGSCLDDYSCEFAVADGADIKEDSCLGFKACFKKSQLVDAGEFLIKFLIHDER